MSEKNEPNQIKFTHGENGVIDFNSGHTVFGDLFMIGAFASTKVSKFSNENAWDEYPTDVEGMKSLKLKSSEIIGTITDTITSLGMMLAYVDRGEVGDEHLCNHAWLVAGLGELLSQLVSEDQYMEHSLRHSASKADNNKGSKDERIN